MVIQKNKQPLILTMEYGNISVTQLKKMQRLYFSPLLEIYCNSDYISSKNINPRSAGLIKSNLVFLFIINKIVNFECISIAKHIINLFNDKLIIEYMRKLVRKYYTPVVPIANTCSIGYLHDGRADNTAYRHDRRADNADYRHDRRADSLSRFAQIV